MSTQVKIVTHSPLGTQRVGCAIGALAKPGDLILLDGDLGAGKTTITQGIAKGMGFEGYVHSPTFVLIHEYVGSEVLYHLDLYRLGGTSEFEELGFEELLSSGACVVEWAGRLPSVFPYDRLSIYIESAPKGGLNDRVVWMASYGDRSGQILMALRGSLPGLSV
jgi:tRNA threonylcarbamoyladenosine biosynthesis protein TsaE